MPPRKKLIVTQDPEQPVEQPILATAIVDISRALKALLRSGLTREAIVTLISYKCRLSGRPAVHEVLNNLEQLESWAVKGGR